VSLNGSVSKKYDFDRNEERKNTERMVTFPQLIGRRKISPLNTDNLHTHTKKQVSDTSEAEGRNDIQNDGVSLKGSVSKADRLGKARKRKSVEHDRNSVEHDDNDVKLRRSEATKGS